MSRAILYIFCQLIKDICWNSIEYLMRESSVVIRRILVRDSAFYSLFSLFIPLFSIVYSQQSTVDQGYGLVVCS